ncbi:methyltransferase-like protein 22 [Ischnura elegans]|uniref:methyltransferase-like protein 22 n=1 Tax=Ischnura elegans TaxID=197161 RepID=UPI001ED88F2D|nr:methyltransferase-like protein 22 [Ischnura elegans]
MSYIDMSDCLITSEVHPFTERANAEPVVNPQNVVAKFIFTFPAEFKNNHHKEPFMDEDGDYLVHRRCEVNREECLLIEHSVSTTLSLVGEQIWRGALLLADFLLHHGSTLLKDKIALELGSGTGLSGIVSALFCSEVICTDLNRGHILDLIRSNAKRNLCSLGLESGKILVEELDFLNKEWNETLKKKLSNVSVIFAADVIYDNDVSEGFLDTLCRLLVGYGKERKAYLAMEKRYVFTTADLDSVAPCYEHFLSCLQRSPLWSHSTRLKIDFPQYFNYERGKDLVLWEIVGT